MMHDQRAYYNRNQSKREQNSDLCGLNMESTKKGVSFTYNINMEPDESIFNAKKSLAFENGLGIN